MIRGVTLPLPVSLASLLAVFGPLFTAPSFRTFCGLACGFLAQPGRRTVCGMLVGAGLARLWPHDRAHWFFSRARWSADELGLAAARLVVSLLVPAGEPVVVAIDDTLFRRRGKKVWAASWFHDGSAPGPAKTGYGNTWVIAAVVVRLPAVSRPVAIPVLAKLVIKGTSSASRLWLARRMAGAIAATLPGRDIHAVADSAYAGGELKKLPAAVTWTTRLRKDAALHGLPPQRTGRRGRPRTKGDRLPCLAKLAATTAFTQVTITRYGKTATIAAAAATCLWPSVFGTRAVTVVLSRDRSAGGHDLALVTTDTAASPAQVIERYAARWSIEVAIEDARQVFGAGQARNRTARAVERTVPFQLACQAIATCWYATAGHDPADVADHRARAPCTPARPSRRPPTWPPSSAASSSPQDLRHLALTSQHPKKSASSAWPGRTQRHNRESRVHSIDWSYVYSIDWSYVCR
jgi:DDE superfamily endonuclease